MNNYAFIDGNNLHLGTKSENWLLDYCKFREFLREQHNIDKAFYFLGYINKPQNLNLYHSLRKSGFLLIFKRTKLDSNNEIKGNVDVELVLHTISKLPQYNKAVIIAGDDDYYCVCKYLISKKKLLKILIPSKKDCPKLFKNKIVGTYLSYLKNNRDLLKYKDL
jgi:uncharacterized LabA/DUF88 family protein